MSTGLLDDLRLTVQQRIQDNLLKAEEGIKVTGIWFYRQMLERTCEQIELIERKEKLLGSTRDRGRLRGMIAYVLKRHGKKEKKKLSSNQTLLILFVYLLKSLSTRIQALCCLYRFLIIQIIFLNISRCIFNVRT